MITEFIISTAKEKKYERSPDYYISAKNPQTDQFEFLGSGWRRVSNSSGKPFISVTLSDGFRGSQAYAIVPVAPTAPGSQPAQQVQQAPVQQAPVQQAPATPVQQTARAAVQPNYAPPAPGLQQTAYPPGHVPDDIPF